MSLSFVSKTIQTSTQDGGFEETPIDNGSQADDGKNDGGFQKPLFEQLRDNQEQEEAERAEFQRSIMRGTLALDEEDAAHLQALHKTNMEKQQELQRQTQSELAAFKAAKADRMQQQKILNEAEEDLTDLPVTTKSVEAPKEVRPTTKIVPKIVKKRRRGTTEAKDPSDESRSSDEKRGKNASPVEKTGITTDEKTGITTDASGEDKKPAALTGLLTGYGSSSDEE